jgi:hypothetical protein
MDYQTYWLWFMPENDNGFSGVVEYADLSVTYQCDCNTSWRLF